MRKKTAQIRCVLPHPTPTPRRRGGSGASLPHYENVAFRLCHTLAPHRHRDRWRSVDRGQAQPTKGLHRRPRQVQQRSCARLASAEIHATAAVHNEGSAIDKGDGQLFGERICTNKRLDVGRLVARLGVEKFYDIIRQAECNGLFRATSSLATCTLSRTATIRFVFFHNIFYLCIDNSKEGGAFAPNP